MKICILTQPLHTNYGGLLQAYALQTVLKRMGHDVLTEDRKRLVPHLSFWGRLKQISILRRMAGKTPYPVSPEPPLRQFLSCNTDRFIGNNISMTLPVYGDSAFLQEKYNFDAYIVGSDQVWRPIYSPNLSNYFLDFTLGHHVKRIAYAASFGTDEWEFTSKQTAECSELVKKFDAVSVREDSGVKLCKRYFGIDAVHLLDPTMLLEKEDYINLVIAEDEPVHRGNVMTYFLDRTEEKDLMVDMICQRLYGTSFSVMPEKQYCEVGPRGLSRCIFPSVTSWLRGFMDADYVVTDSFHGTVFSIIFNKPFIAIANKERGLSRFSSLLKMFGLEDRLVFSAEDLTVELLSGKMDFNKVNAIRRYEQAKALMFIENSLK